jgi:hypothetical protein
MSDSSCSLQTDCVTSAALALALGRVSSPLLVLHDDTGLSSKRVFNSCLSNRLFLVLWFYLYCLCILKLASFQYQSTLNQLLVKNRGTQQKNRPAPIRFLLLQSAHCARCTVVHRHMYLSLYMWYMGSWCTWTAT